MKRPIDNKIEALLKAKRPTNRKEVRSILGSFSWYRSLIPRYTDKVKHLTELTKKSFPNKVQWNDALEKEFNQIKRILTSEPVLKLVDYSKTFFLYCDASETALSGILCQKHGDIMHPVNYISRKLEPREKNYIIAELETLALIWSLSKLHYFLYGRRFVVLVDSTSLFNIRTAKKQSNARLIRWGVLLSQYDFEIRRVRSEDNPLADLLSRLT